MEVKVFWQMQWRMEFHLLVQVVEKFKAAGLDLNLQEIFIWYFEQKGVDNAERFLGSGVNQGVNVGENSMAPSLPMPLLQAMAQNLQKGSVVPELPIQINELQKVKENRKDVQ